MQTFDKAAAALGEDWDWTLDGKQIQRWAEAIGRTVAQEREAEVRAFEQGHRPASPLNAPTLLVIGLDGGRVQMREKTGENESRWREDQIGTFTTYLPGEGTTSDPPQALVTTYVATMQSPEGFGKMVRVEAERRGLARSMTTLAIGDGGNWIDPLIDRERLYDRRIVDYYHAVEHLYEAARAAMGKDSPAVAPFAEGLKEPLWNGRVDAVIAKLCAHRDRLGPPQARDGSEHPRRVLANNLGYFTRHKHHLNYPEYRRKGWPIGSGMTEAGVKQFNKRVKGPEQFWKEAGGEVILSLRALWLSQDDRWNRYWSTRAAYSKAA
ncbi:MAG: hypothetical protein KJ749_07430 [Planctomycetes bacterium]|nr:hypothetical protein [Planctomycetota bacterium]